MERFAPVDHASISEPVQFVVRLSSARTVKCDCEDLADHPQPVQRVMGCFSHSLMHFHEGFSSRFSATDQKSPPHPVSCTSSCPRYPRVLAQQLWGSIHAAP